MLAIVTGSTASALPPPSASDSEDDGSYRYPVALSAMVTDATHTLADSASYEPSRQVQVLRLHPNP